MTTASRPRFVQWTLGFFVLAATLSCAACEGRPVAPELNQTDRHYDNPQEGFHFDAPADWYRQAHAEIPQRRHDTERLLVKFKKLGTSRTAFFRASLIDLPASKSEVDYLRERPPGGENWRVTGEPEKVTVNGRPGTRVTYTGKWDREAVIKEIIAVRRGDRVHFFTGIYVTAEPKLKDSIRETVATISWYE